MKNKKVGRSFGRVKRQREALVGSLVEALVLHGHISTTLAKAKELGRVIDPYVNYGKRAQEGSEAKMRSIRQLRRSLSAVASEKLCDKEFSEQFKSRTSGYTRIVKTGPRGSDNAEMAVIEFV